MSDPENKAWILTDVYCVDEKDRGHNVKVWAVYPSQEQALLDMNNYFSRFLDVFEKKKIWPLIPDGDQPVIAEALCCTAPHPDTSFVSMTI